jgi:hypothetical protein
MTSAAHRLTLSRILVSYQQTMRPAIQDEFTKLNVSRQVKFQLRMRRDGRCTLCGAPAVGGSSSCLNHLISRREDQRKRKGSKGRYNSLSYRLMKKKPTRRRAGHQPEPRRTSG